jgi:hypothetical protein
MACRIKNGHLWQIDHVDGGVICMVCGSKDVRDRTAKFLSRAIRDTAAATETIEEVALAAVDFVGMSTDTGFNPTDERTAGDEK